ncbi:MAG: exodeoxyribonuclease VII large subunit [Alphaproteobacteria bacterium]|nr:exodeoxyribonuclease VII large subunit [Alphaproteobacteria bacterium]
MRETAESVAGDKSAKDGLQGNLPEWSVSEISTALKRMVEDRFAVVRVRGEISGLKFHSSGHVYFDLKDDKAVLNAVVWRGVASRLKMKPEGGAEVICTGKLSTYAGSSRYQLIVEQMELAGLGALMAMLEERRKRLAAEGLFDEARKQPLPFLPEVIGVITSPTGAVIRDIMHRLTDRFPRRVLLWPVAVQGEGAGAQVAAAIAGFNAFDGKALPRPDLLIVARGGGSVEDLMAFNDEAVVRAAAESRIPLISAVGHETDTTLIDYASDWRAPTPTAAAERAVPVRTELLALTLELERRLLRGFGRGMEDRKRHLAQLARLLPRAETLFATPRQRLDMASDRLQHSLSRNLQSHSARLVQVTARLQARVLKDRAKTAGERLAALSQRAALAQKTRLGAERRRLESLARLLDGLSYRGVLERGFALVRGADGSVRRRAAQVTPGEALNLTFADGTVNIGADGTANTGAGSVDKASPEKSPPKKPAKPRARTGKGQDQGSLF